MAHFAEINSNNIVTRVLVVDDANEADGQNFLANTLGLGGTWVQTSYNTKGGIHYASNSNTPDNGEAVGMNYAGIGYSWDGIGFAAPQPYPSWTLDKETYLWTAPVAMPTDGKLYSWNEDSKSWDEVALASNA
jgi:hypothetical protein